MCQKILQLKEKWHAFVMTLRVVRLLRFLMLHVNHNLQGDYQIFTTLFHEGEGAIFIEGPGELNYFQEYFTSCFVDPDRNPLQTCQILAASKFKHNFVYFKNEKSLGSTSKHLTLTG